MKIYEVFFVSLISSLMIGAVLFVGVPFVCDYATTSDHSKPFIGSEDSLFIAVFYGIYVLIQFWLSVINLIQVNKWVKNGMMPDRREMIYAFLKSEGSLYLVVFALLLIVFSVLMKEMVVATIPFIFAFSIPYAICCTASVFIFRHFIFKLYKPETDESESEM